MSQQLDKALYALEVSSRHYATIQFVFTEAKRDDDEYRFSLADDIDVKIQELARAHGITENVEYLCQGEGHQLVGNSLEDVVRAGRELATFLSQHDGIEFV